jgi:hypothetical protein
MNYGTLSQVLKGDNLFAHLQLEPFVVTELRLTCLRNDLSTTDDAVCAFSFTKTLLTFGNIKGPNSVSFLVNIQQQQYN